MAKSDRPNDRGALKACGLDNPGTVYWNLSAPALYQEAIRRNEAMVTDGGALTVATGVHTGRSPRDKFIIETDSVRDRVDWNAVNRAASPELFARMQDRIAGYLSGRDVFVQDCFAGADPAYRLKVRVISEAAWSSLFARNMFIRPAPDQKAGFEPDFTILHAPGCQARGAPDGLNSETFILVDFDRRMILIGGTHYAGEIKKSIFGVLNFLLPDRNVLPMHCSANAGPAGDTAIFFGLSGTGKTTLSTDPTRILIGDDEHGWSETGIFNFEGGCYAKVINLSETAEPEIHAVSRRFGSVLENVVYDPETRQLNFFDASLTENTRACYPLDFIENSSPSGMAGHPQNIIMLTADAFGVLPPVARLTAEQAMYHFLSGYTARVAGTEKGMGLHPEATFSTCFGAPFMPRHPTVYGELLRDRIARYGAACWLINTGWTAGRAGDGGRRMDIAHTRAMVRAALDGRLAALPVQDDECFGLQVPQSCPDVPPDVLRPRSAWPDKSRYDATADELRGRFVENFRQFESHVGDAVKAAGIRAAA